jgi:hypothetical protein
LPEFRCEALLNRKDHFDTCSTDDWCIRTKIGGAPFHLRQRQPDKRGNRSATPCPHGSFAPTTRIIYLEMLSKSLLRGADVGEEFVDVVTQRLGLLAEFGGRGQNVTEPLAADLVGSWSGLATKVPPDLPGWRSLRYPRPAPSHCPRAP